MLPCRPESTRTNELPGTRENSILPSGKNTGNAAKMLPQSSVVKTTDPESEDGQVVPVL
jgi:hypothetical protein